SWVRPLGWRRTRPALSGYRSSWRPPPSRSTDCPRPTVSGGRTSRASIPSSSRRPTRRRCRGPLVSRRRTIWLAVAVVVLLLGGALLWALPELIRRQAVTRLPAMIGRAVSIGGLALNVFTGP